MTKHKHEGDFYEKIIVRAWKDPHFKEKLLKHPRAAFKEMGFDFAENVHIKVMENNPKDFYFVLPMCVKKINELSDKELEKLAGAGGCRGCGRYPDTTALV